MKRRLAIPTWLIVGVVVLSVFAGAAAAIGLGFQEQIGVEYGEVTFVDSDLSVTDYDTIGPGMNVDGVEVTIENLGDESVSASVTVWLMSGETVVQSGSASETWSDGETISVELSVDRVKTHQFDAIDIEVVET